MVTMHVEIITAEERAYADDVEALVAPGIDGELGILPHHAPLITALQPGEIMVRKDGQESYMVVSGGFIEVMANQVTILADACEHSEEIDEARAQEAMQHAQERLANRTTDMDLEQATAALRRAEVRLTVFKRRRRREAPPPRQP